VQVSAEYPYRVGDIVVFKLAGRDIPIVHRVLKVHEKDDGDVDLLTKGDNNKVDDRGLYNTGQKWLNKEHVIGRARGYLPYVGMVTIIMNDYPMFKCAPPTARHLTLTRPPRSSEMRAHHVVGQAMRGCCGIHMAGRPVQLCYATLTCSSSGSGSGGGGGVVGTSPLGRL